MTQPTDPLNDDPPAAAEDAASPALALVPGQRVRVTQQVAREGAALVSEVVGTVVERRQAKTGSWYAHAKDDKLWLDRLELRKDDGEICVCNIDRYTRVDVLEGGASDA